MSSQVIEYCLFQPGLLLDYLTPPGTPGLTSTQELWIDFDKRRAIKLEGKEGVFTGTRMDDIANFVVQAIGYAGEWPTIGGIHRTRLTDAQLIEIVAKIHHAYPSFILQNHESGSLTCGNRWRTTRCYYTILKEEDVRADIIKSPWIPEFVASEFTAEQNEFFSKLILKGCLLSGLCQSWVVSDEWNCLLPDYKFTDAEEFLLNSWAGKA
ncbi:hypothetical protein BP6252_02206 [Coleophoma cylindrospora]|uniref:NmrA-like domain-containing protein n=1 Tax=Coleophoma cylindrospora TaxID=1849047 RepID=A0A3D8SE47_9HELO|nr:hypothetical protein BP6252_02206 [Coleophoma cylindrospora]